MQLHPHNNENSAFPVYVIICLCLYFCLCFCINPVLHTLQVTDGYLCDKIEMFKKGIKARVLASLTITSKEEQEEAEVCDVIYYIIVTMVPNHRNATSSCMRLAWLDM